MLQNKVIDFNIKRWQYLESEVKTDLLTTEVKKIQSNGYWKRFYNIDLNSLFTAQHFTSLKLYTDYTTECSLFCSTLRSSNMSLIAEIANWARLLSECIQCYGTRIENKKYYRGVNNAFNFEMFAIRFNLPTSTTTNFNKALNFSHESGTILELKKFRQRYEVYKFDCSKLACFDENETLFFGGDTVLQIKSIFQAVDLKWKDFKKYITPMNAICRMVRGLSITHDVYSLNNKQQQTMFELLNHVFCIYNSQKSMMKLPDYIDQLLKYQTSNRAIQLKFIELQTGCKWLRQICLKEKHDNNAKDIVNIANICKLFANVDLITFMMPKNYIFSYDECISLINDFTEISAFEIMVRLKFVWPLEMPNSNRNRINQYQHDLKNIEWVTYFTQNALSFECIDESVAVQKFVESKLYYGMSSQQDKNNGNSYSIACRKVDIQIYCMSVVNAFVNEFERQTNRMNPVPFGIVDLILFMYAKPIAIKIKYENTTKHFLLCPSTDVWKDIELKIIYEFHTLSGIKSLHYEYGGEQRKISEDPCRSELMSNSDKTFDVVPVKGDVEETPPLKLRGKWGEKKVDIITRIDKGLKKYYKQCHYFRFGDIWGDLNYTTNAGNGKFELFCNENSFDNEDVEEELKETDSNECQLTDFDPSFPFMYRIVNDDDKPEEILKILKHLARFNNLVNYDHSYAPKQVVLNTLMFSDVTQICIDEAMKKYSKMKCIAKYLHKDTNLKYFFGVGEKYRYPFLAYMVNAYTRDNAENFHMKHKIITISEWAKQNKWMQKLKKKNPKIEQKLKVAMQNYSNRIMKRIKYTPIIKINDELREICEYFKGILQLIALLTKEQRVPFQLDLCIAVKAVQANASNNVADTDEDDSDEDDNDQDEDEDEDKHEEKDPKENYIGDVVNHLRTFGVPYFCGAYNIHRPVERNLSAVWTDFRTMLSQFNCNDKDNPNKQKIEYDITYPTNRRFGIFVDRRENDEGFGNEKDKIIFFQPPSNCNKIGKDDVHEIGFELLQRCLIPRGTVEKPNHITAKTDVCGQLLTFVFNAETKHKVQCYIVWNGETMRFEYENIINVLPYLFVMDDGNKEYIGQVKEFNDANIIANLMKDDTYDGFSRALKRF